MRSTMLPPSTAKARCATVSPIAEAITARTASCVSGFSPAAVLACCRSVATNARSCGLRMRSSRTKVSENESKICFGVMRDTPPCVFLNTQPGLGPVLQGKKHRPYTESLLITKKKIAAPSDRVDGENRPPERGSNERFQKADSTSRFKPADY